MPEAGFVPPPYPQDRLAELRSVAAAVPGGAVDCSVGDPVDPMPDVAVRALTAAAASATGYPPSVGTPGFRSAAAGWIGRCFGARVAPDDVIACVGTKEVVAALPRLLSLRDPSRDTVLYPSVAYATYEMGARLAGLRPIPIPVDDDWLLDVTRVEDRDADRALIVWLNEPTNPTGASMARRRLEQLVTWARGHGAIVASDECYAEFTYDDAGEPAPPVTALAGGTEGVLAVHSLSKRSNMAGLRVGFVAGAPDLVAYLGLVRRHAGLIVPTPVQAAAAAALDDDKHVREQQARYAKRRRLALGGLGRWGVEHVGGPSTFYLWLRGAGAGPHAGCDGWELAARLAAAGLVVMPGELYGAPGAGHVRMALTQSDDRLALALDRLSGD
jgi:succinyldiaminopimelate transaminase